jgi:hypothetical protein
MRTSIGRFDPRPVGPTEPSSRASSVLRTPTFDSRISSGVSSRTASMIFTHSFSIRWSTRTISACSVFGMSLRTPPARFIPYDFRLPVIRSISHITGSRIRHVCIRTVSNPRMWPAMPSHSRWLWTRSSSSTIDRMYRARSGASTPIAFSSACAYAVEWTKPQMPQMRSATNGTSL